MCVCVCVCVCTHTFVFVHVCECVCMLVVYKFVPICVLLTSIFITDGLSYMTILTLAHHIMHSRESTGMLSLTMTTVLAQIYTNPTRLL